MDDYQNPEEKVKELEKRLEDLTKKSKEGLWQTRAIPAAIIITGFLIAVAIYYSGGGDLAVKNNATVFNDYDRNPSFTDVSPQNVRPVNSEDHIVGNALAPIKIIEFSDLECPFCKKFHPSLKLLMEEYGSKGQVAWVFRHFPLDSIHSKARKEAQATECANELGGNEAFWTYIDKLYEITPSNNQLDLNLLPKIAEDIGLSRTKFLACLDGGTEGGKYANHIEADYQDASVSGGTGTPYSIIIAPSGETYPITGAQSYTALKALVELALKEK